MNLWTVARRMDGMKPSALREILRITERPDVLSMAGGLPASEGFAVNELRAACEAVLCREPAAALQYGPSEGWAPLRAWVAAHLRARGARVDEGQVLITSGSQQALDLIGKVLIDPGAPVAVELPTYLGALQAFDLFEPTYQGVATDAHGPLPGALAELDPACRFLYLVPNFQNPTGRLMPHERREAVVAAARGRGLPLVEDDPYGELWCDAPPPVSLQALWPQGVMLLGSFSKTLAPGLRLGWLVAPPTLFQKLLVAKQAADLHSASFTQRVVHEVLSQGVLAQRLPALRQRYRGQRDAMHAALTRHLPPGCEWQLPAGGMFFWLRLPPGCDAQALLPAAVEAGIAFVPGAPFFVQAPDPRCLRLSFVTLSASQIDEGVRRLACILRG
ncbi:MAG: PLP-dependent aminotransferase family protein [Burkholderiales bacterium]